jgi:acyl carrier protein
MDHQVKIRGFRIELGEIENALGAIPGVREAAVIAREDTPGDKRLVAYFSTVPTGEVPQEAVDIDSLRTHLSASLPEFMVPAAFVHLESLPLSPNGKLDRKALPAPKADSYSTRSFEAPADDSELKIAEIWREVLQCTQVGREDNFFDLGGNSLHLMKVHGQLREAFHKDVAMVEMFRFTTIRTLANHLTKEEDSSTEEWTGGDVGARRVAGRRMRQLRKQVASELFERTIHERAAGD